jgi:xanthine dehydrogenase small subunit
VTTTAPVQFFHRGELARVTPSHPTQTVLDWLRESARCTGTKEGCNEGDCGACTVVVGTPQADGTLALKAVNSCIQFVPTLHGKALITVEDLAQNEKLHPCQQAMVECHGSQCGFCTPGFVMTLFAHYENTLRAQNVPTAQIVQSRAQIDDVLSGNLCRCTGYRPIIEAAQRMFDAPRTHRYDDAPAISALKNLAPQTAMHAPTTRAELAAIRAQRPNARLLAGSTDIGLWVTKQFREIDEIIYVGNVAELQDAYVKNSALVIGAAVTLERAYAAIAQHILPGNESFKELWLRFASPLIRNAGTLVGNVANGSPIGDSMPALIALGARIVLQQGERVRAMPLEDFYLAYQKTALESGEFVAELEIPVFVPTPQFRTYKLSKRFDQDISAVCFAGAFELKDGVATNVRIALGGMAATPKRAQHAEAALEGTPFTEDNVRIAMQAMTRDFTPLTDMRASADYRMRIAQNFLLRMWHETNSGEKVPTAQSSVRHVEALL